MTSNGSVNSRFLQSLSDPLGQRPGQTYIGKNFHQTHFITMHRPD